MGRRSDFKREARDFYETPYEAVLPLLPHLISPYTARGHKPRFIEPCAGAGKLVRHLERNGLVCVSAIDIEPKGPDVFRGNALNISARDLYPDFIITNPPFRREMLHPMIRHFRTVAPCWLLFDANWMFTAQAAPYLKYCAKIVTIGRVKWIEGSKSAGMEDMCWYYFLGQETKTEFVGKDEKRKCDKTKELFSA